MIINLNPDQNIDNIVLPMIPAPVISGHTYFPNGEPLAAAAVQALRWRFTPLGPRLKTVKTTLTDDNGEYRLFGMALGEYLVSASYSHSAQRAAIGRTRLSPNVPDPDDGYATIFYRSETNRAAAQKVRLAASMDTEGVNIILSDVRRFKVRGRAVATEPVSNLKIIFVPEGSDISMDDSSQFQGASANESFEIPNVTPGAYALLAFGDTQSGPVSSDIMRLNVGDADASNVVVPLLPAISVAGRITLDGRYSNLQPMKVRLVPSSREIQISYETTSVSAGGFTVKNVGVGDYDVFVDAAPPAYAQSIRFGARDLLNQPLRVGSDPNGIIDIQMSAMPASAKGSVVNAAGDAAAGVQVVLIPEVRLRRRSDRYVSGVTDAAGNFQVNVPPGQYTAYAFERVEPDAWYAFAYDPAVERRFANRGARVNVTETRSAIAALKLIPASETAGGL
jgi:hypothetical protein